MKKFTTKIGDKFHYLTIKEFTKVVYVGKNKDTMLRYCLAECDCGDIREYSLNNIKSGRSKSCGCKPTVGSKQNITVIYSSLYKTYTGMVNRCYDPKNKAYKNYGGRNIIVCDRWLKDFMNFIEDMGDKPSEGHSIDRIDVNGNYEPSNCRWATRKEQANNLRITTKLTANNLAKLTGYTSERIRQMTNRVNSRSNTKELLPFVIAKEKLSERYYRTIYSDSAIQYLLNKRSA